MEWGPQSPFRPFCSKRCQLIDLGEWADEQKRIPGEINPDLLPDPERGDPWQ
ncbi:DNA gyrase inhibitor YacG [Aeromonas caviae]|uniref:DNA gyrase inhibitor YacG n=1 Tax=Aeromonas caviae TaxID=648 RepID=UPI001FBB00A2|nr:DNA gyrase inhibitor YacG [Aeromonas caviae]